MINEEVGLFIADVLHQARLKVDEKGTEAASATEVEVIVDVSSDRVPEKDPIEVRFDRPFLVLLADTEVNTLIFLGKVEDPTAK